MQVNEEKPYDEINITPMLDLAYVLLVIFILMTTATVTGLKARLPRASKSAATVPDKDKMKAITVSNQGTYSMDGAAMTLQQLEASLQAHKVKRPDFSVVIRGDSGTPWQCIVDAVEMVNRVGVQQVGLPTKPR